MLVEASSKWLLSTFLVVVVVVGSVVVVVSAVVVVCVVVVVVMYISLFRTHIIRTSTIVQHTACTQTNKRKILNNRTK